MQYQYVRYLNQSTTNYVVSAMVNQFIAKDVNKEYAFEVNFVCQGGGATTGARIQVYKPDFEQQKLVYLGQVDAGTNLSPQDLDNTVTAPEPECEFEEYFTSVNPEYVVFQFLAYSNIVFVAEIVSVSAFKVKWGDGTETEYQAGTVTITHTYENIRYYSIRIISENEDAITGIEYQSASGVRFDLSALPRSLTSLSADFDFNITGDVADLPQSMTFFFVSGNSISGNTKDLPRYLTTLVLYGQTTLTGSIEDLPRTLENLGVIGNNTMYGRTDMFPPDCTQIQIAGFNTISYELKYVPNISSTSSVLNLQGYNTVTGDLGDLQSTTLNYIYLAGFNTISQYTSRVWNTQIDVFYFEPMEGSGLSSAEIDQLLIDLSALTFFNTKTLALVGGNAPRTSASDAAVASLQAQGVTVTTNP